MTNKFQIPKAIMNENVNFGGTQQNAYSECEPAAAEDPNVYVSPVCRYLYVREVLHIFVEAPGVTRENVTFELTDERPDVLIILAVAKRQHRLDRHYLAQILMPPNHYVLETEGWDVSNGEIHLWFPFILNLPPDRTQAPLLSLL